MSTKPAAAHIDGIQGRSLMALLWDRGDVTLDLVEGWGATTAYITGEGHGGAKVVGISSAY